MKKLLNILIIISIVIVTKGQDCYKESINDYSKNDFSNLWTNRTFQGTIGDSNLRIQIRFINIEKQNELTYLVKGKSKVNSNICDFSGQITINSIRILDNTNPNCEGPDFSFGILKGKYIFKEDPKQEHVGKFTGEFQMMFDKSNSNSNISDGWYGHEGFNSFIGKWKDYNKETSKFCSWGYQLPPSKNDNLVKHYDNDFYLFNPEYLSKGWKSYVLTKLNSYLVVPKDYNTKASRYSADFYEFTNNEIEESRKIESEKWWE